MKEAADATHEANEPAMTGQRRDPPWLLRLFGSSRFFVAVAIVGAFLAGVILHVYATVLVVGLGWETLTGSQRSRGTASNPPGRARPAALEEVPERDVRRLLADVTREAVEQPAEVDEQVARGHTQTDRRTELFRVLGFLEHVTGAKVCPLAPAYVSAESCAR